MKNPVKTKLHRPCNTNPGARGGQPTRCGVPGAIELWAKGCVAGAALLWQTHRYMMDGGMWLVMCGVMWLMVMEGMDGLIGMLVLWMEAWHHSTIGCVVPERWHYGTMGVGGAMEEVGPWHYRDGATMEEVALWRWETPWRRRHHGGGGAMVATLP